MFSGMSAVPHAGKLYCVLGWHGDGLVCDASSFPECATHKMQMFFFFCGNRRSHLFKDQGTTNFRATDAPIFDFEHLDC